ncbi:MAG: prepilin-type N-terminal cleavage/methylation domain-containing protein [Burkholderiaceae bacterium]|jgi:type IV pilus assembly protein PilE|nr:prepilin-type N-terminal cleavage/methylation domain-containing protein [Burkholderiaceae bacterium]
MSSKPAKSACGFTLIELMIVVAVIAILAAIAYPSYAEFVRRANRANAKEALLKAAQWMERTATAQGQYPNNPAQLAAGLEAVEGGRYNVCLIGGTLAAGVTLLPSVDANICAATNAAATPVPMPGPSATTFTLAAYRIRNGANASDKCGDFIINQTGARGVLNNDVLTVVDCWGK